jgi:hypothetical protein
LDLGTSPENNVPLCYYVEQINYIDMIPAFYLASLPGGGYFRCKAFAGCRLANFLHSSTVGIRKTPRMTVCLPGWAWPCSFWNQWCGVCTEMVRCQAQNSTEDRGLSKSPVFKKFGETFAPSSTEDVCRWWSKPT